MSQLDENLLLARNLCRRVNRSFKNGPSNLKKFRGQRTPYQQCVKTLNDNFHAGRISKPRADMQFERCETKRTDSEKCVSGLRDTYGHKFSGGFQWRNLTEVKKMVQLAEQTTVQCGNCGEMAGKVLVIMEDYSPSAAVMSVEATIRTTGDEDNHQFVIIGGNGKSPVGTETSFPKDAVVCDPWAYKLMNNDYDFGAYPAAKVGRKLNQMLKSWEWSKPSVRIFRPATKPTSRQRELLECANNSRQGVCLRQPAGR